MTFQTWFFSSVPLLRTGGGFSHSTPGLRLSRLGAILDQKISKAFIYIKFRTYTEDTAPKKQKESHNKRAKPQKDSQDGPKNKPGKASNKESHNNKKSKEQK